MIRPGFIAAGDLRNIVPGQLIPAINATDASQSASFTVSLASRGRRSSLAKVAARLDFPEAGKPLTTTVRPGRSFTGTPPSTLAGSLKPLDGRETDSPPR